jgi:hypothetical protein
MDVNRARGAHLDVRNAEFGADAEDDAEQLRPLMPGMNRPDQGLDLAWKRWWFDDFGEDGHGRVKVGNRNEERKEVSWKPGGRGICFRACRWCFPAGFFGGSRNLVMKVNRSSHSAMLWGERRSQFLEASH